jgi:uncharacterized metal-binding protein
MMTLQCVVCGVRACQKEPGAARYPDFCPIARGDEALDKARAIYAEDEETRRMAVAAARTEADRYPHESRVEEVMSFARRMGANHLGIATCAGLIREARIASDIFAANGFDVSSVCCKVGSIPKEEVGLEDAEKIRPGQFEAICNPIGQAKLLNAAGTQLNVLVGLCVGHDSLFFKHSEAPVTVLIAKDRRTGHNPAAALYTYHSYYGRLEEAELPPTEE